MTHDGRRQSAGRAGSAKRENREPLAGNRVGVWVPNPGRQAMRRRVALCRWWAGVGAPAPGRNCCGVVSRCLRSVVVRRGRGASLEDRAAREHQKCSGPALLNRRQAGPGPPLHDRWIGDIVVVLVVGV